MADETTSEFDVGLSDEEKEDLERLIKGLRQDVFAPASGEGLEDIYTQMRSANERLAQFGEVILKLDSRMKSLCEILRLGHEKSEAMNRRIDSIIESMRRGKGL